MAWFQLSPRAKGLTSLLAATAAAPWAYGQAAPSTHLVNAETGLILPRGSWEASLEGRLFGGDESNGYGGLRADLGLGRSWGLSLRGAYGARKLRAGLRYGGSDAEAQIRYGLAPGLSLAASVAMPDTPARRAAFLTTDLTYRLPVAGAGVYIGLRGRFGDRDDLTAAAIGFSADVALGWSVVGDLAYPLGGDNAYRTGKGRPERLAVYGIAVRYAPAASTQPTWTLGLTNGLGPTTGFSTSAALGGAPGLFVGLTFRG